MEIKGNFPTETEKEHITDLGKYDKLYENETKGVLLLHEMIKNQFARNADIIYMAHAIPARITEFFADLVQGDSEDLSIENSSEDPAEIETLKDIITRNNLQERIYDIAVDQSKNGYAVLLGRVTDGKYYIDDVPADQYFPQKDGSVILATYFKDPTVDPNNTANKSKWLYVQHYKKETGGIRIIRKAYSCSSYGRAEAEKPLIVATQALGIPGQKEEEFIANLDIIPVWQIDNGKRGKDGYGKSDYASIIPQLAEINERVTQTSVALLKNLDAKLQLPKNSGAVDKSGKLQQFDAIEVDKDSAETKYIINDNPLLAETREHINLQLKMISWITATPMFELLKTSMPERAESLRMQLFAPMRRATTKRSKINKALREIIAVGFKLLGKELKSDISIKYSDVLPTDRLVDAQIEEIKVNTGLSSRFSSIKRLEGMSDDRVDNELKLIQQEGITSGAVNTNNPPQL